MERPKTPKENKMTKKPTQAPGAGDISNLIKAENTSSLNKAVRSNKRGEVIHSR